MDLWNTLSHFWNALSNADKISFTIALCTEVAAVTAAYSALLARRSIRGALEEFRAQAFLGVLAYEREVGFSEHMDSVRPLHGKPAKDLTDEERKHILAAVNFLNLVAHLIRHRYIVPKQMLLLYAPSIAAYRDNLLGEGQWLKELQKKQTGESRSTPPFPCRCARSTRLHLGRSITPGS